jgi:hypothetical protein
MEWIYVGQDTVQLWVVVHTVMNILILRIRSRGFHV